MSEYEKNGTDWTEGVFVSEREEKIFEQIGELAKKYKVSKIVLFGSRARRDHREKSDIDIAVYGCQDFDEFSFAVQENVWTLLEFDIVNMNSDVSEELLQEIEKDGVVIYEEI